ncbi:MAG: DNA cytosine methyltransferase, partial [Planctomycetota bacterium]
MATATPQLPLFDTSPAPPPEPGRTVLEFFAGVGLARIGFEQAGWRVVWANDYDPMKRRQYEGHFGPSPHLSGEDIHAIADRLANGPDEVPDEVPDALLAHASFPCTDLSLAGGRRGLNAGESSAFWGFYTLLEKLGERRPPLVLLENVTGLISSHGGQDFRATAAALCELGYAVDALVLDAAHFVPQSRPRLFIVGKPAREGGAPAGPALRTAPPARQEPRPPVASVIRPQKLLDAIAANRDLAWNLADLPEPPPYGAAHLEDILDDPPDNSPQWWSGE